MTHDEHHHDEHHHDEDDQRHHESAFDAPDPGQARVRDLLRAAAPAAGPMPADVVARLDAALAQARTDTAVASLARRRRGRLRTLQRAVTAAAGIAVVAVGGGLVLNSAQNGSDSASSTAGGSMSAADSGGGAEALSVGLPADAQVLSSGADYTGTGAAQDLAAGVLASQEAATQDKMMLKAPAEPQAATADPDQRPVAEHALTCTTPLGVDPASVLAVEVASWRSQPAALVVHRTATGAEVVVVAVDCTPGDAALSRADVPS